MNTKFKMKDLLIIIANVLIVLAAAFLSIKIVPIPSSFIGRENIIQLCRAEKRNIIFFSALTFWVMFSIMFWAYIKKKTILIVLRNSFIIAVLSTVIFLFFFPISTDVRLLCEANGYKGTRFMKICSFIKDVETDLEEQPVEASVGGTECSLTIKKYTDFNAVSSEIKRDYIFMWGNNSSLVSFMDFYNLKDKATGDTVKIKYYKRSGMLESIDLGVDSDMESDLENNS